MKHGYARKKDANSAEIEKALIAINVGVIDTSALSEFCDLITMQRGQIRMLEVKNLKGRGKKLTTAQCLLHDLARLHGCTIHVVTSVDEALRLHGART